MANITRSTLMVTVLILSASHMKSGALVQAQDDPPDASTKSPSVTPTSSEAATDSYDNYDQLTTIEVAGTSVSLCTDRHLCSSLGCGLQSFSFLNRSMAGPLCQCDRVCTLFNDCCVDYEDTCMTSVANVDSSTFQRSQGSNLTLTDFTCYFQGLNQLKGCYVISACPHDNPTVNDDVRQRCERGDSNDFFAGLPVFGVKNDFPYRNVYCALCWQEATSDLEPWTVTVKCEMQYLKDQAFRLLSNSTSRETLQIIRDGLGCNLLYQPPKHAGSLLRLCRDSLTEECPLGHPLAQACASYTAVSAANHYMFGLTLYKNPHCFLCSNEERIRYTSCSDYYPKLVTRDNPSPPMPAPPFPDILIPPISIVFDFRSGGNVKVVTENKVVVEEVPITCSTKEVYDPFLSRCHKLSCADGYTLEGGRCIRSPTIQHGQETVVYIHVSICTEPVSSMDLYEEIVKSCLVELANANRSQFQPSMMESALLTSGDCLGQPGKTLVFKFKVQLDREAFLQFHFQLLATEGRTFCPDYLQSTTQASVEVIYHDASLALARCTGRWESGSVDDSSFDGNLTIHRDTLKLQEPSGAFVLSSYDVQICTNPDLSCLLETFNRSLFRQADSGDGVLVYLPTETVFTRDEYIETPDGEIQVCSFNEQNGTRNVTQTFTFFQYSLPQQILNLSANVVSMLTAVITFVTFCVFKELQNRTSGPIMNFTAALFLAQLLLLLSGAATQNAVVCTLVALLGHYFLLVSVMWTGVLAFILNRTFTVWNVQRNKTGISLPSVLFAWGVPFLVALPCLILHLCRCTDVPLWYGDERVCWVGNGYVNIVVVGVPIGLVVLTNVVLFSLTVCGIRKTKKETRDVLREQSEVQQVKEELIIYIKIATLMGFTWIFGFLAAISDVVALWYVFILLNASQCVHIFLSFICNKKVWQLWSKAFQSRCCSRYARADDGSKVASRNTRTLKSDNTGTTNV